MVMEGYSAETKKMTNVNNSKYAAHNKGTKLF